MRALSVPFTVVHLRCKRAAMQMLFWSITLCQLLTAFPLIANDSPLKSLDTGFDSQGWDGVGRLDLLGLGFCSAVLIEPDLVLTAGHCTFDKNGKPLNPEALTFHAGIRYGRAEASREISRITRHPDYKFVEDDRALDVVSYDIALLRLDHAITHSRVQPFPFSLALRKAQFVSVVSYGSGRDQALSLQDNCQIIDVQDQALVLDCEASRGTSGAPVFSLNNGRPEISSLISAFGYSDGQKVALGVPIHSSLPKLLEREKTQARRTDARPTVRRLQRGGETSGAAKFIKP